VYPHGAPDAIITADCIRFATDDRLLAGDFAALLFETAYVRRQVLDRVKGVAQQKISLKTFRDMHVQVPPREEQELLVASVTRQLDSVERLAAVLGRAVADAAALRQSLLQRAFSGQLTSRADAGEVPGLLWTDARNRGLPWRPPTPE
jgi:type I restriction enzyme, S subunit